MPKSSTAVTPQHAETRLMSWSTRITSAPVCSGIARITSPRCSVSSSGSPAAGSSSSTRRGWPTTARATSTRRRSRGAERADLGVRVGLEPDELDRAEHVRAARAAAAAWSARGPSPRSRRPTAPRSPARSGRSAAAPSGRGGNGPSRAGPRRTRCTLPADGRTNPLRTLKNVVLPAPLGPISPHVPLSKRDVHPVQRGDAAEADGQVGDLDHRRRRPPAARGAPSPQSNRPRRREVLGHLVDESRRARSSGPGARRCRTGSSASRGETPQSLSSACRNLQQERGDDRAPHAVDAAHQHDGQQHDRILRSGTSASSGSGSCRPPGRRRRR